MLSIMTAVPTDLFLPLSTSFYLFLPPYVPQPLFRFGVQGGYIKEVDAAVDGTIDARHLGDVVGFAQQKQTCEHQRVLWRQKRAGSAEGRRSVATGSEPYSTAHIT